MDNRRRCNRPMQLEALRPLFHRRRSSVKSADVGATVTAALADETADIAGDEQLSIGIRFIDSSKIVREEFLGFSILKTYDANGITDSILSYDENYSLDLNKLVGLGFDGCSVMASKENGVQSLIRNKYSKATFFHCASHRLNLVVNDLISVTEIRNTIGIIKNKVRFEEILFQTYQRCGTRWSAKYKSIRIFSEKFIEIKEALDKLSHNDSNFNFNIATRSAGQLF
ncbi:zinc finger MYM-type protein 1-like [Aphis craccivora]|uniref:Zinc finger MYM-type protein 1-like n=1 Tax=Aphis craccivora TaxID=307492 RepID=A0A6G0W0T2_APHCR|nr:zinc finger MYM-type protein 1-like [Aphis craccivora]